VSEDVVAALADDLNTPLAITRLHAMATQLAASGGKNCHFEARVFLASARMMGLLTDELGDWMSKQDDAVSAEVSARIDALIAARRAARADKDFAEADRLRAILDGAGVVVIDRPDETSWSAGPGFDAGKLEP
jgi:cysteinyl-tRNA synthetase